MKTRTMGVLAVLLVVLAAIHYMDYRRMVERQRMEFGNARVLPFLTQDITAVTVAGQDGTVRLELRDEDDGPAWWVAAPIETRADQTVVGERLLNTLSAARKFGRFEIASDQATDLGFDEDALRLVVESNEGESFKFAIGRETAVRNEVYLRLADEPEVVWVTGGDLPAALAKSAHDFRDKRVLPGGIEQVVSVRVTGSEGTSATVRREASGAWRLEAGHEADPGAVRQFVEHLAAMEPLPDVTSATLVMVGQTPLRRMRVTLGLTDDAGTDSITLNFVAMSDAEESVRYRAVRPETGIVYAADAEVGAVLENPASALRESRVIRMDAAQVRALDVAWRSGEIGTGFRIVREPDGPWRYADNAKTEIEQERVDQYVMFALRQRVEVFDPQPAPAPEQTGLDNPILRVAVEGPVEPYQEGFEVGNAVPGAEDFRFARRFWGPQGDQVSGVFVMGMPEAFLDVFQQPSRRFGVRRLLPFDIEDAVRVVFAAQGEDGSSLTLTLTRTPDGASGWSAQVNNRDPRAVPQNTAIYLLGALRGLDYVVAAEELEAEVIRRNGMDEPSFRLSVQDLSGSEIAVLVFDRPVQNSETALVRDGSGRYYFVASSMFATLNDALGKLLARLQ